MWVILSRMLESAEKPRILLNEKSASSCPQHPAFCVPDSVSGFLPQRPESPKSEKARILDVGRPGADSGFCRSVQQSPKRRGFWMLDGPARILGSAPASRIPQEAQVLDVGRPGADTGFWTIGVQMRRMQNPESRIRTLASCRHVHHAYAQNAESRIQNPESVRWPAADMCMCTC